MDAMFTKIDDKFHILLNNMSMFRAKIEHHNPKIDSFNNLQKEYKTILDEVDKFQMDLNTFVKNFSVSEGNEVVN
jgi:hypothetical protein